jgi:hypothetical protein
MIRAMDTNAIAAALQAEITRLSQALSILTGGVKRRGRPPGSKNSVYRSTNGAEPTSKKGGRTFTAAQRKAHAVRMRKYWADKKKAGKTG